ncbi:hypothetical protein GPECTOR_159g107 [Gonium pectorale]|uniref:Uncharacterized protein n=1 Tax=Gonium pectorale TaxID=33097 RepID=A0A150FXK8_GONPE|nr:hypothetical protein GPECTOR_159g107 [Gonium pectorale]|eukprot:KXZ42339.1 hypothetical protein GPECTOR_159g107 [Gonium pectorale]
MGKSHLEAWLKFVFNRLFPVTTFVPSTHYLLRKLVGAKDWTEYMVHVCDNEDCIGHVYEKLPDKHTWKDNLDEKCPHCSETRFKTRERGGRVFVEPRYWYIDFGVEETIQYMAMDADFVAKRGAGRDPTGPGAGGHYRKGVTRAGT